MKASFLQISVLALIVAAGPTWAATSAPDLVPTGYTLAQTDSLASRLINSKVYSGTAADAPEIGYIKDVVLDASGQATAVILGIGGFLGAGEKNVAVAYSQIQWAIARAGTRSLWPLLAAPGVRPARRTPRVPPRYRAAPALPRSD